MEIKMILIPKIWMVFWFLVLHVSSSTPQRQILCGSRTRQRRRQLKQSGTRSPPSVSKENTSTQDLLYLTDSESLLKTISKWVGEGTRANLATTPDGDLVREIVQILQKRVTAGANTFLIKIKSHRGEPLNEAADSRAAEKSRRGHQITPAQDISEI
jgi:hypothetical protein